MVLPVVFIESSLGKEENTKGLYVDRKTTLFEYHIVKVA